MPIPLQLMNQTSWTQNISFFSRGSDAAWLSRPGTLASADGIRKTIAEPYSDCVDPVCRMIQKPALNQEPSPGTLVRLEGRHSKNLPGKASVHQLGFADLLVALELLGESPEEIVLLGVQPLSTEWGTELTPPVMEALGRLPDLVIEQLQLWAVPAPSVRN